MVVTGRPLQEDAVIMMLQMRVLPVRARARADAVS
jgi:hypothetical protein